MLLQRQAVSGRFYPAVEWWLWLINPAVFLVGKLEAVQPLPCIPMPARD